MGMDFDRFLQGRSDCTSLPPNDFADMLREVVMPVAPAGHTQVHLTDGTLTAANENACSTALMTYAMRHKRDYSSLCVLGFQSGTHGNSVAMLSAGDSALNQSATYDWPTAPMPQLSYPFQHHEHANAAEEDRCVSAFEEIVSKQRAANKDVGAVIIEPITAHENRQGTPTFYKRIRAVCAREGIPFIVDETRTGLGQTGKMWAHEYWYLNERDGGCADIVTFGGKAGVSGFYSTLDYRLNPHCASFDQDVDMVQLLGFGTTWKQIQNREYLEKVQDTSSFLKIELGNVQRDRENVISNIRGNGTMIGFDAENAIMADLIESWLAKSGIQVARVGPATFGLRPALVLGAAQAAHLRDSLRAFHPNHAK